MNRGRPRGRPPLNRRIQPSGHHHSASNPANLSTPVQPAQQTLQRSAPQRGRPRNSFSSHFLSFSSPSASLSGPRSEGPASSPGAQQTLNFEPSGSTMASNGPALRRRSRVPASSLDGSADEASHSKGGHSLRKRARVDYTQEQIDDDLGFHDSWIDPAAKSAGVPGPRARRRRATQDFSGDDSDDMTSTHKRRRSVKSPFAHRAGSVRRKSSARKPSGDIRDYLDQPSDNEVQDTILVGVSMDELESSPVRSEQRSESGSGEEDAGRVRGVSLSREVQEKNGQAVPPGTEEPEKTASGETRNISPVPPTIVHESIVPDNNDLADNKRVENNNQVDFPERALQNENFLLADQLNPEPSTPPSSNIVEEENIPSPTTALNQQKHSSPPAPSTIQPRTSSSSSSSPRLTRQEEPATPPSHFLTTQEEPTSPPPPSLARNEEPAQSLPLLKQEVSEVPTSPSTTPTYEMPADSTTAPMPEERRDSTAPSAVESLGPQRPQPRRLQQLDSIYQDRIETGVNAGLSPYEDGEILYPSPWVQRIEPESQGEPTPTATPGAEPSSPELTPLEKMWDGLRPLKVNEFFNIYRAESARRQEKGLERISMQEFRGVCNRYRQAALAAPPKKVAPAKKGRKGPRRPAVPSKAQKKRTRALAIITSDFELGPNTTPDATPLPSPAPESAQLTPARSPEPTGLVDGDADQVAQQQEPEEDGQDGQDGDAAEEDGENEEGMEPLLVPGEVLKYPKKQYLFREIRDASHFEGALEEPEKMETSSLYSKLASCAETLKRWQDEYNELRKITDDEENAKRRQANDKTIENWDNRQKLDELPSMRRTFDDKFTKLPAPFEVNGIRAPAPYVDDPVRERQKAQDRIQAQAYGFVHNDHPSYIGRQRPAEQRYETEDAENETRLRDRKHTQKAADAADENVIIEGKRIRKPRILDNQQNQHPSRVPTPAPAPATRKGRKRNATTMAELTNGDVVEGGDNTQNGEAAAPPLKRRARGKPQGKAAQEESVVATPEAPAKIKTEDPVHTERSTATRKRGRPAAQPAAQPEPFAQAKDIEPSEQAEEEVDAPKAKRQRIARSRNSLGITTNIPPTSFYSNPSPADTQPDSRPSTSSSATTVDTVGTVASSYSLREKRKRNYAVENDPELETRPKKRTRTVTTKTAEVEPAPTRKDRRTKKDPAQDILAKDGQATSQASASVPTNFAPVPGTMMSTFSATPMPPPSTATAATKRPPTKIKFVNSSQYLNKTHGAPSTASSSSTKPTVKVPKATASSAPSEPEASIAQGQAAANGATELGEKPYSEMSKSEKMSYSMRRRWARGEMQGAVEKRKHTLALKAEAKATNTAGGGEQQQPSSTTAEAQKKSGKNAGRQKNTATARSQSSAPPSTSTSGTPNPMEGRVMLPPPRPGASAS